VLPPIRKYIEKVDQKKITDPKTKSSDIVKEASSDPLIEVKLRSLSPSPKKWNHS
jgi:hypothetical protein